MSTYFGILTEVGEAKEANAHALGVPLRITAMAVGDGGGTLPTPNAKQTALIGQKRRAPLNRLYVDSRNANWIVAEQVIPENEGGWWIRELGLYDENGDLVAVANCPPTYKPQLSEGSGRTQVIRMVLLVTSSNNFTLKIDPSVVLATREYVDDGLSKKRDKDDIIPISHGGTGRDSLPPYTYLKSDETGKNIHSLTPEQVYYDTGAAEKLANELAFRDAQISQLAARTGRLVNAVAFSTSGTYTKTPGVKLARFKGVAAGGGSGGTLATAANQAAASGAGGAGNHFDFLMYVDTISSIPITIGAAGAAGTSAPTNGGNGGDLLIGSYATIKGGRGGAAGNAIQTFPGLGGVCLGNEASTISGSGTFGVLDGQGQSGVRGIVLGIVSLVYSLGGNSAWGRGGTLDGSPGIGGGAVGAGVGQNVPASAGFQGGPGILIVEEYA